MRLQRKSKEPDLVVEPTHLTVKEAKEISKLIKEYKLNQKKKKHNRHKTAA